MNETPNELLAPYKAALVAAARDLLRAAASDGIAIEIPASVPPSVVVLGAEDQIGKLLRQPACAPMVGGRRAGDVPPDELQWEEAEPGIAGLTAMQISVAARHMCNRSADACGVDREDNWKVYGQTFIDELREALELGAAWASGKGGEA